MPRTKKNVDASASPPSAKAPVPPEEAPSFSSPNEPELPRVLSPRAGDKDALITRLIEQNERLMELLHATAIPREGTPEALVTVANRCGAALGFSVTDVTGRPRIISLQTRHATTQISPAQLGEAKEKYPHYFENGWVEVVGEETGTPNLIPDLDAFLASLSSAEVRPRIEAITSVTTLTDLFHRLESLRYERASVKEGSGEEATLVLKEKDDVDPFLITVQLAVQKRLQALTGVRVSLDS